MNADTAAESSKAVTAVSPSPTEYLPTDATASPSLKSASTKPYKRASRRGAPRRFPCTVSGCDKVYSRAEHLNRHQLNHNPKQIFCCDIASCWQKFVRADLLARHKKRHNSSYVPRNREPSFTTAMYPTTEGKAKEMLLADGIFKTPEKDGKARISELHRGLASGKSATSFGASSLPLKTQQLNPSSYKTSLALHSSKELRSPRSKTTHAYQPPQKPLLSSPQARIPSTKHPMEFPQSHDKCLAIEPPPWPRHLTTNPALRTKPPKLFNGGPLPAPLFLGHLPAPQPLVFNGTTSLHKLGSKASSNSDFVTWLFDVSLPTDLSASTVFADGIFGTTHKIPSPQCRDNSQITGQLGLDTTSPCVRPINQDICNHDPRSVEDPHAQSQELSAARQALLVAYFRRFYTTEVYHRESVTRVLRNIKDNSTPMLKNCILLDFIRSYWTSVAPRLPIIHQPTFSPNSCPVLLLLVIIALGAVSTNPPQTQLAADYADFADMIVDSVRWEILRASEAVPPVELWTAQALLLVEFYEMLYSSRRAHERAQVYHGVVVSLLQKGDPLVDRSHCENSAAMDMSMEAGTTSTDVAARWRQWVRTEAMHRVIFTAFMLDTTNAAMFGHAPCIQPHEIRLPLPCQETLWTAETPNVHYERTQALHLDNSQFGTFLNSLRSAVHGNHSNISSSFAQMAVMSGLLSVAWHVGYNSPQPQCSESRSSGPTPHSITKTMSSFSEIARFDMILAALDNWSSSLDNKYSWNWLTNNIIEATGPISSSQLLCHLSHITLQVSVIDCQIYAGAWRLLGRPVLPQDYDHAATRISTWARSSAAFDVIAHAAKLLRWLLCAPPGTPVRMSVDYVGTAFLEPRSYDPQQLWAMYLATLAIWVYVQAYTARHLSPPLRPPAAPTKDMDERSPLVSSKHYAGLFERVAMYLDDVCQLTQLTLPSVKVLARGIRVLLELMEIQLSRGRLELLQEAGYRLQVCAKMLREPK
ncbi:hypothetical protein BROUX41_004514 [Berkeleyomyces rouxiae]|uniref:uncharacterized protein n=1 Tax=Berkeleyomyces rouxiae TaxID=2035830 RepID=UPI003B7A6F47